MDEEYAGAGRDVVVDILVLKLYKRRCSKIQNSIGLRLNRWKNCKCRNIIAEFVGRGRCGFTREEREK